MKNIWQNQGLFKMFVDMLLKKYHINLDLHLVHDIEIYKSQIKNNGFKTRWLNKVVAGNGLYYFRLLIPGFCKIVCARFKL